MKKLSLLLICLAYMLTPIVAQNENPILFFKGNNTFNYKFDYTGMQIEDKDASDYIFENTRQSSNDPQKTYENYKKRIELSFLTGIKISEFGKYGFKLSNDEEQDIIFVVSFSNIKSNGAHTVDISFVDKKTGEKIEGLSHRQSGGRGEFRNVFIERLTKSGESIGDKLCDKIRNNK